MSCYYYDSTPFIVLNSDRIIDSIPFKKEDEFFLFHSCKNASEDVLMQLLNFEFTNLEETLEYIYEESRVEGLPKSLSLSLPMRVTPRYELLDSNCDMQILLKWFHQLLSAVEFLHDEKIIHSNIHPNSCYLKGDSLVLGELQDIIIDNKYDIVKLRSQTWAPEIIHEDLRPYVSNKMDIFMLGIVLGTWLDSYFCTVPMLHSRYLPSKLNDYIENLDDFMQITCLEHADLFPPIFKHISDFIIKAVNPNHEKRPNIGEMLAQNLISVVKRPAFVQNSWFGGLKREEWAERNIKRQFDKRKRVTSSPSTLWFV
eukprot:NODE_185_length_13590_cov_0.472908.p6 type:complete len:313 gc:universal NODE_185_length_13590_cov_0.472908:3753-2815(-)